MVQGLGLHTFTAEGTGSVPGWGTKIPQAAQWGQKKKKKKQKEGEEDLPYYRSSENI